MTDILKDYFEALERLKREKPVNVPKGTKITNDSVSLEAGRKKGTIKRSRPIFSELIEAIDAAAKAEAKPEAKPEAKKATKKATKKAKKPVKKAEAPEAAAKPSAEPESPASAEPPNEISTKR